MSGDFSVYVYANEDDDDAPIIDVAVWGDEDAWITIEYNGWKADVRLDYVGATGLRDALDNAISTINDNKERAMNERNAEQ